MDEKTTRKIETMRKAGEILGKVLEECLMAAKDGVREIEIDSLAERKILEYGGEPGFKRVDGYKHSVCTSTNEVVVHGIPRERILRTGDIFGIDCGVYLEGYHTDMAESIIVGGEDGAEKATIEFLRQGKKALFAGIKQAKPGNHVGDISHAIQTIIEGSGYSVVRSLVGHGVGKELHEEPEVPGYMAGDIGSTPILRPGMTIAIEVIYNMGEPGVVFEGTDDWTIVTEDGSLAGLFERTVVITEDGVELLTKLSGE